MLDDDSRPSPAEPAPPLTTVSVHAGAYLAHDLASAMPLVCTSVRQSVPGETLWERTALALQRVQPAGPYPKCDALTVFVRDNGFLVARFDVNVTWRGAVATLVVSDIPRIKHAPIPVMDGDDVVAVARKIFAAGLPQ